MNIDTWAVVFATLLGPVLAVQAQRIVAKYGEQRQRQLMVFRTLMKTRIASLTPEHVDTLNAVPLEFHKDDVVMKKWRTYLDHLNSRGMTLEVWGPKRLELYTDLLATMAAQLDYGFDPLQLKNEVYSPQGHAQLESDQEIIRRGLVALMKGEAALPLEVRSIAQDEEVAARLKALQEALATWLREPRVKIDSGINPTI